MSTTLQSSADRFERDYPATLPARLQWLEERLQIERDRILRLMGLPADQIAFFQNRPWKEAVRKHELVAERAEHLLTHYLSYFDYDLKKASEFPRSFAEQLQQGRYNLNDYIPGLAFATTPVQREDALLATIHEEDSRLLPVLASFLAAPARNGHRRPRKRPS